MKTRVLVLIKGLGMGGAEQLLVESAAYWDRNRFEYRVAYVIPWKDQLVPRLTAFDVLVDQLGAGGGMGPGTWRRFRELVKTVDPHLIHAHLPTTGILARLAGGRPVVYTEHNLAGSYRLPTRWLNRATYGRNAAVGAVSGAVAASLAGYPGPDPIVIHNGVSVSVSPEEREAARSELGLGPHDPLVVQVGNIRPHKGHETLIKATRFMIDRHPHLSVVAIGGEKYPGDLQRVAARAAEVGLGDRIRFLGRRDDARRFIAASDVFCNPSDVEGLPLVVLEALALERPVVATAVGGVPSVVINGETGMTVPAGRPELLGQAVLAMLIDPERHRMAKNGAKLVEEKYGAKAMVQAYEDLYLAVLGG